jgi:hypothetical protein
MELAQRVDEASGLGRPQPNDPLHPLDRDLLGSAQIGRLLGLDDGVLIRVARVDGENLRRIAQAEPEFYHEHVEEPLLASGMDEQQIRAAASQMSEQLAGVAQRMLVALYTRHQERYTIEHLVEQVSLPHGGQPVKSLATGSCSTSSGPARAWPTRCRCTGRPGPPRTTGPGRRPGRGGRPRGRSRTPCTRRTARWGRSG